MGAASSSDTACVSLQAAMCYIHIAALIAEYLKRKGKMTTLWGRKSPEINMLKSNLK